MASGLISSRVWLSQTNVPGSIRSKELKALDDALRAYELSGTPDKTKVKQALEAWKNKAGSGWATSQRNRGGAMTELDNLLSGKEGPMTADLQNAREGLLYLFAKTKVKGGWASMITEGVVTLGSGIIQIEGVQNGIGLTDTKHQLVASVVGEVATRSSGGAAHSVMKPGEVFTEIKKFLMDLGRRIADAIAGTWSERLEAVDGLLDYVFSAVNLTAGYVWQKAAPFVGSGIAIFQGMKTAAAEFYRRFMVYQAQKGLAFHSGHAATIFRQIETAMEVSIGKGVYQAMKGAAMITADAVTFGSSAIASVVIAGVELLVKLITRFIEMKRMRKFFASCEPLWEEVKGVRGRTDGKTGRPMTTPFVADALGFADWFKGASFAMPCLSMIALKSGIAGDKMRMVRLYTGDNDDLTDRVSLQNTFDKGVEYIDRLKAWGNNYLEDTGFKFYSSDAVVNGLLNKRSLTFSKSPGVSLP